MSVFTETLNYTLDNIIRVRVTAYNNKGPSNSPSEVSTGIALSKLIPKQMASTSISYGEQTSSYQIMI